VRLFATEEGMIDLLLGSNGLALEDTLRSAIIISLLTDRRALPDDRLPEDIIPGQPIPPDRRGWAGDALSSLPDDRIGSRLWLLSREKQTEETRLRAIEYIREAVSWLITDGYASSVSIIAEWGVMGRLEASIIVYQTNGGIFTTTIPNILGVPYAV
jgi:phage gp46-like protein